jgi:ubiquitin-like protein Pup
LKDELDDMLDEIDEVLAENGQTEEELQAFVDGFVQRGGQ